MADTLVKKVMVTIQGDDADAAAKIEAIRAKAEELKKLDPAITPRIDRAVASAELAVFREELKKAASVTGTVDVDTAPARAALDLLKAKIKEVQAEAKKIDFGGMGSSALWGAGIAAATGPGPVILGGALAGALGVGSALAAGGAGLGLFAAVAKSSLSDAAGAAAAAQKAQDAYNTAVEKAGIAYARQMELAKTAKQEQAATASYNAALQAAEAQRVYATGQAYAGLSRSQVELAGSITAAKSAWQDFVKSSSDGVASVLAPALGFLPGVLKQLTVLLPPVELALSGLVGKVGAALQSSGFGAFISTLSMNAGPAISALGDILLHLASIAGKVVEAFAPVGVRVLGVIDRLLARADAGTNSAIERFFGWLSDNGPQVMGILRNLGSALVDMGKSFFSLGSVNIAVFSALASFIATIARNPIGADALAGLLVLTKVSGLLGPLGQLVGLMKSLVVVTAEEDAAMALNPVGLIILAVAALGVGIFELATHWHQVWGDIVNWTKDANKGITTAFDATRHWFASIGDDIARPFYIGYENVLRWTADASHFIEHAFDDARHWFAHIGDDIAAPFISGFNLVIGFFEQLPGWMEQAGWNIMVGIWNGLVKGFNWLISGVVSLGKFIGNALLGWAGIHFNSPPSEAIYMVMAGRRLNEGLAKGLNESQGAVGAAMARTGAAVTAGAGAGTAHKVTLEFTGNANDQLWQLMKRNIRVRGGNVQIVGA